MTEAEWESTVVDTAHAFGWMVAGFRPGRTKQGWRTPVKHEGKGWPDLVFVRDRLVVAELKADKGRLSEEQRQWVNALSRAGVEVYIWRPSDFDEVVATMRRRG